MTKILNRPISVLMLTLALVIFGWRSLQNLETSLLPEIEYPEFFIITEFPGGSPEEIEQHITIPLEEVLSSLQGLQDIVSHSREGLSIVEAQFNWNIDFKFTLLRIREKIDAILYKFPEGTERPFIMDFNPGSAPVMELVIWGKESLSQLSEFAEDVLKPRFSQLKGIASAHITGAPQPSIQIRLKPEKIAQYGIPVSDVITAIKKNLPENTLSSTVMVGYTEYPLNVRITVNSIEDFLKMPIQNTRDIPLRLGDIAEIRETPRPQRSLTYYDTTQVIGLNLYKESGANTVLATNNALELIRILKSEYPGIRIGVIKNRGEFVTQAIASLQQAISIGALLAFLIILFFLKHLRLSLLLSVIIPISLLVTFTAMYLQNITLNIMSLGGLALGIGLIVDNGIVVTESISRELKTGWSASSVISGTSKVARAIVGSTLTTIAIFFPIIYVKGYASILFENQALTIIYTLIVSLFASLTLLPTAIHSLIVRAKAKKDIFYDDFSPGDAGKLRRLLKICVWGTVRLLYQTIWMIFSRIHALVKFITKPLSSGFDSTYNAIYKIYHRLLISALNHKKSALFIGSLIIIIAYWVFTLLPKQYWPTVYSRYVEVEISVPVSTPFSTVRQETEKTIQAITSWKSVESLLLQLTDPGEIQKGSYIQAFQDPGFYDIKLSILFHKPITNLFTIRDSLLRMIALPGEHIALTTSGHLQEEFFSTEKKNFIIYFSGKISEDLREASERTIEFLRTIDDCRNVSLEMGGEMYVQSVSSKPTAMIKYDLTPAQVSTIISQQSRGETVGKWQRGNRKIPVDIAWEEPDTKELSRILEYPPGVSDIPAKIKNIVTTSLRRQKNDIVRVNRKRVISVQADVPPQKLTSVVQQVQEWLITHKPAGVEIAIAGESKRIAQSFHELKLAFMLAVVIVYLILAAQFESLIHPINIILTVPMGLIGAVFGLTVFHQSFNVISLIGIVMLIGIGVNDAIIKVDYMNFLRRKKQISLREAVLLTSEEKFRPVLMTTLTTIFAMMPMLFGIGGNSEINQPLAATIIGGLTCTTILTLIFTPVLYEIFDSIRRSY